MFLVLLTIFFTTLLYFKLFIPYFYWYKRGVYYVSPWKRLAKVFFSDESFFEIVRKMYKQHSGRRYIGGYQFLKPSLFVTDLDLIKQITVKDFSHFTDHSGFTSEKTDPIMGNNLFSLKGQRWREMRSTLSPAFSTTKMKTMFTLIAETAENFTEFFLKSPEPTTVLEMRQIFAKFTNDVIANCALGVKCDSLANPENDFFKMGQRVSSSSGLRLLKGLLFGFFPQIFEWFKIPIFDQKITTFFQNLIEETVEIREKQHVIRPDMIHILLEARKGQLKQEQDQNEAGFATVLEAESETSKKLEITNDVITAQALVFFIAGFSTTSSLMSFMCYELALHPEIQHKLQEEVDGILDKTNGKLLYEEVVKMKFLDQIVSETLRKWPPGYVLNRVCVQDYIIPPIKDEKPLLLEKGCLVSIPVIGIHMDAQYFPEPENFDPGRFSDENRDKIVPGSYFPFGSGPRNCIGSRFALLEIKALMASIIYKFKVIKVEKTQIPLKISKQFLLDAKEGVWLGLKKRKI